jgi:hypothetical protein
MVWRAGRVAGRRGGHFGAAGTPEAASLAAASPRPQAPLALHSSAGRLTQARAWSLRGGQCRLRAEAPEACRVTPHDSPSQPSRAPHLTELAMSESLGGVGATPAALATRGGGAARVRRRCLVAVAVDEAVRKVPVCAKQQGPGLCLLQGSEGSWGEHCELDWIASICVSRPVGTTWGLPRATAWPHSRCTTTSPLLRQQQSANRIYLSAQSLPTDPTTQAMRPCSASASEAPLRRSTQSPKQCPQPSKRNPTAASGAQPDTAATQSAAPSCGYASLMSRRVDACTAPVVRLSTIPSHLNKSFSTRPLARRRVESPLPLSTFHTNATNTSCPFPHQRPRSEAH